MTKMKLTMLAFLVKYWEWLVRWIAGWSPWAFYPAAIVSGVLLLASWGLTFPIDWIPVIDELVTLKLAALAGHALLVRHKLLTLQDHSKGQKKLHRRSP